MCVVSLENYRELERSRARGVAKLVFRALTFSDRSLGTLPPTKDPMDSHQEFNSIAAELICSIDKTLPIDPVVSLDGRIFDRSAVDSTTPFYPSPNIKRVIEIVVGSGRVDEKYLGRWARRRKTEVEEAIEKAEAGDADSMVKVGERYLKGDGIDQDETKGYEWFCKASEKDHVVGTTRKADCLIVGIGVEQDKDGGHQILLDAIADGDPGEKMVEIAIYLHL